MIDKGRALNALLTICKLNDRQEREQVTYRHLYGDKDTWWLGFHLIDMPYSFVPTMTASIGQITNRGKHPMICGHILHFDEAHRPLWWNGAMFTNRYVDLKQLLTIEAWAEEGKWIIKTYSCLIDYRSTSKKFSDDQQKLINAYRNITKNIFHIN